MVDFVRNASLAASHGYWQIIEWQMTDVAGEYVVWAMTNKSQLQKLKVVVPLSRPLSNPHLDPYISLSSPYLSVSQVVVPRVMYVNCRGREAEEAALALDGARIKRDLPHARPLGTLFEVAIPERKFIRNEKALALFLCDPQVTQTPHLETVVGGVLFHPPCS